MEKFVEEKEENTVILYEDEAIFTSEPTMLLYLPSHCSFLNAAEHLRKDVRSAVTHNTLFDTFKDMIAELKNYMRELKTHPEKLAKLCRFIY